MGGADVVCDAQAAKQKRMAAEQERKERDSARKQAQAERKRRQQQEKEGGGRGRTSGGGRGPGRGRSQHGGRGGADQESEEEEVVDSGPRTAPLTVPELQERFDELDVDGDGTEPTTPCICAFRELTQVLRVLLSSMLLLEATARFHNSADLSACCSPRERLTRCFLCAGEIGMKELLAAIEQHKLADWYDYLTDYDPGGSMFDHFVKFDTDGDGVISFTEFCAGFGVDLAAAEARTPTPEGTPGAAELYDVFCRIDSDGDKRVTGQEVATAIQEGTLLEWVRRLFRRLACTAQC